MIQGFDLGVFDRSFEPPESARRQLTHVNALTLEQTWQVVMLLPFASSTAVRPL